MQHSVMFKTLIARILTLLTAFTLIATGGYAALDTPAVTPHPVQKAPVVDGVLDDAAWEQAPRYGDFRAGASPARAGTAAQIVWDGEAFYIAFHCKSGQDVKTVYHQDGDPVWQDESVELFIAPWNAPSMAGLYHFTVSAAGVKTFLRAEQANEKRDWQAAVNRTSDGWTCEMRIPVSLFDEQGPNEAEWRILFCRNSSELDESSSWPASGGRFANFWNYARLVPPEGKPSFTRFRARITPREGHGPRGIQPLKQAAMEQSERPVIIPEPVYARFHPSTRFEITPQTPILIGQRADRMDARAAEVFADWVEQKAGFRPPIRRALHPSDAGDRSILIGEPSLNPAVQSALRRSGEKVDAATPGPEGYVIRVTPSQAIAAGSDQLGTFWAAQTLAQMLQISPDGRLWLPGAIVRDRPAMPFRSVHLLTAKDTLEFQTRLIREVLSPFKIRYVILQMDKFGWESHPEIRDPDNHVTAEDLRKLIAFAKDYHITYIPLVMSLGHMEWIFRDGANMDIVEDPAHPYAYCPLNERSYELMQDLFDEAFEVFGRPSLFHIGHDEFDMRGEFPKHEECRKLGKVELYYRDTLRLAEYLRKKGARTMMWGDILAKNGFRERLGELPKDIIIADWRYGDLKEYPTVDLFRQAGFDVVGCTWYLPGNIYHFSTYAHERGAIGMMQTTWTGWNTADQVMKQWPEQMFQYVLGAEWAWSPGRPPLDAMPYEAEQVFLQRWYPDGSHPDIPRLAEGEMFAVQLGAYANASLRDLPDRPGWIGAGPGEDFSALRAGDRRMGSVTFRILSSAGGRPAAIMLSGPAVTATFSDAVRGIQIGSRAKQLWFLHTTAFPDGSDRLIGRYIIRYEDGTAEEIPLKYGVNTMSWQDNRPTLAYQAAWKGQTKSGKAIRLRMLPWDNPHPEKTISTVDFVGERGSQASPALLAITGIR
jgi:hypothetical protein